MKMIGSENDREKVPLMKDLHELGLNHGVTMVVVAIPIDKDDPQGVRPLLIDHRDDTTIEDMVSKFTGAGVFLIKCAAAGEEHLAEQEEKANAQAEEAT